MLNSAEDIYYQQILEELKQTTLVRLKAALIDKRAMFQDLSEADSKIVMARTQLFFKYFTSLNTKTAGEWVFSDQMDLDSLGNKTLERFHVFSEAPYVYERYVEKGDVNFGSEFALEENEILGCLMVHVWDTKNEENLDFSPICNVLRLDEATYNMVKRAVCAKTKDNEEVRKRLEDAMCSRTDLFVLLTMAQAEAAKWPFTMDWKTVQYQQTTLTVEDVKTFEENLSKTAEKVLEMEPLNTAEEKHEIVKTLSEALRDVQAKTAESMNDLKKLSEFNLVEMIEEHVGVMEKRREIVRNHIPERIQKHRVYSDEDMTAMRQQQENCREETAILRRLSSQLPEGQQTFKDRMELKNGQTVLARKQNSDYFVPARIINKQIGTTYTVQFLDSRCSASLEKNDIANAEVPLFDRSLSTGFNRFIGMRVVALVDTPHRGSHWIAGTVGAAFGSHGDSFLVFFDHRSFQDRYVNPIHQAEKIEARMFLAAEATRPVTTLELSSWVKSRCEPMKMFPLCEQAYTHDGTEISRTAVYRLVTDNCEIQTFLHRYFEKFPDWPLVRMRKPQNNSIPQRVVMADKRTAFVVDVDRTMCLLRFPRSGYLGDDCFDYPCFIEEHCHQDEWLYRGSTRFSTVNMDSINNTNLSTRQKNKTQAFYTKETKLPTARKSNIHSGHLIEQHSLNESVTRAEIERQKVKFKYITLKSTTKKLAYKFHSTCTKICLGLLDKSPYDMCFKGQSPLAIPLLCGWMRNAYTLNFRGRSKSKTTITYVTPCGRTLRSMKDVGAYLKVTDSQLTIDLFTMSPAIDPLRAIEVEKSAIVEEDYSQRQELFPIPAVNTLDDEKPPKTVYCARKYPFDERVNTATISKNFCSGCSCEDDCSDPDTCECQKLTKDAVNRLAKSFRPEEYGYEQRVLKAKTLSGIFECNENCKCNTNKCFNRVVQNEIKYPMQLFKTAGCGWGVRAVCDIPKGTFIANYVGALMTDEVAESKGHNDDQYFADLDLNDCVEGEKQQSSNRYGHLDLESSEDEEDDSCVPGQEEQFDDGFEPARKKPKRDKRDSRRKKNPNRMKRLDEAQAETALFKWSDYFGENDQLYVLDAKYKGNIGRFLNHSCDPNVHVQHVLVDTHDLRLPWSSFFACKDIKAGQELCWNYNYRIDETRPAHLQINCYCGTKLCSGRLL